MKQALPFLLVLLALVAGLSLGFWVPRWGRKTEGSVEKAVLDFSIVNEMVGTYTVRLKELTSRITKMEMMLIDIRKEMKNLMDENERLQAENKALKEQIKRHDELREQNRRSTDRGKDH